MNRFVINKTYNENVYVMVKIQGSGGETWGKETIGET